ncbi:urease accessory protein [Phlyctema vagabunda]|uniref:Urease accessory protein n=1 Tax=Phlyctema vagabunda TaxID=108571 RepID=A0ABR4PQW6_9HELO
MMLNWWLGKSVEGPGRVDDGQEPPETPAPIFAARAVKSAIFGTPAPPPDDDTVHGGEAIQQETTIDNTMKFNARSISPTKPNGILLTPGTATSRRKTVSFGNEVVDNESKDKAGKSGIPNDCPGKFPSPWSAKSTRKTALTRTLENARNSKTEKSTGLGKSLLRNEVVVTEDFPEDKDEFELEDRYFGRSKLNDEEEEKGYIPRDEVDGDMTLDINEPHSQSGKYWKDNYDRYHEEAKAEMRKLLKYKQLAKSYAKKKDAEAIDLGEKLKEEQRKVSCMEHNISELVAQIASIEVDGGESNTPALMKELARQTAMAVQYRALVQELRDDHEGKTGAANNGIRETKYASPGEERKLLETQQEPQKIRENLQDLAALRNEVHSLKLNLSTTERENKKLALELSRTKLDLERSEKRRQNLEEGRQKRDEMLASLQKEYDRMKSLAKTNREYGVELATKKNDQVRQLKTELLEAQHSIEAYEALVSGKKLGGHAASKPVDVRKSSKEVREVRRHSSGQTVTEQRGTKAETGNNENANPESRAADGPAKNAPSNKDTLDEVHLPYTNARANHLALSEIVNNANSEDHAQKRDRAAIGFTPLANRFSDMTLDSPPKLDFPSPEPSLPAHPRGKSIHEKTCAHASPRPSIFTYPSSPPKMTAPKPLKLDNAMQSANDESKPRSTLSRQNSTKEARDDIDLPSRQRSSLICQANHLDLNTKK